MKIIKGLGSLALLGILLVYSSCGGGSDPAPPITDVQIGKLNKTWRITSVTLDGVIQNGSNNTSDYTGFQLVLAGTTGGTSVNYTATSRPALSPWQPSGSFTFGTNAETELVRNDDVDVTYSVTDTQLQMTFSFSGSGYTRSAVVSGVWVFTFGL
jgi:hypothetical protein